ncbi:helix-turn-helix domain-containing protein [Yoonia sp. I 8.24]|uniref:helix-turn-helix domain-containing protein n=1 Tax=Yoonia sp. I 8.24 TaxID=1537229 RepID=UPI001EDE5401|nr:helix-turn-helix domain-containing protein [Yoonia sp. I 8.24]MCG3269237.1 helix-turn-helix transcriptional regulator [Yoonia sp. I 8.24]
MTDLIKIDSERLKAIRKGRKIGRPKLAKLSGLTERKLAKIEAETLSILPHSTVAKLSDALQVPEPTLTGDFPLTQEDLNPIAKSTCTSGCCG